jgi:hypothetical protein
VKAAIFLALGLAIAPHDALQIHVGDARVLQAQDIQRHSVAPAGIVDVRPGAKFIIVGKRPGQATLHLYDSKSNESIYDITVT